MTKQLATFALAFAFASGSTAVVRTQEAPAAQPARASSVTPLKVQVVISRFQGEKRISSMPYTLSVNALPGRDERANLRMGAKVPVVMMAIPTVDGKPLKDVPTGGPIQYQDVGTNIDCLAKQLEDGRYQLQITVDDSSVYPEDQATPGGAKGNPSFRSFRATDSMVLRDGGTAQFTTATDKINGEVVKVDVTLTVVK